MKHISVGYTHCAALCDTGELFTWGSMSNGRCGQPYQGIDWEIRVPTIVWSLQGYLDTSAKAAAGPKVSKQAAAAG